MSQSLVKSDENNLQELLKKDSIKSRFKEVLGKRSNQFASSIISAVKANKALSKANPLTVIQAAMQAAVLDLPIDSNLGFAYLVPYKGDCSFQMGYKGFIQLALRTGEYQNINVVDVREGELTQIDRLRDEYTFEFIQDSEERMDTDIVGYAGYFRLNNGFEKVVYWSKEQLEHHALTYSQNYRKYGTGLWKDNFDSMAKKTVIKNMLNKWGILSIDFQKSKLAQALEADQAVILDDDTFVYPDNPDEEPVNQKTEVEEPHEDDPFA